MPSPLSTYRLQMRGDCFTFADAEDLLPYLDDLGVSHLYLSPILTAMPGPRTATTSPTPPRCPLNWVAPTDSAGCRQRRGRVAWV